MQISHVHITPVAVADPPLLNAAGLHAPYALRLIVELVSADGLSGWGEIPGSEASRAALETAAGHVIGMDPWQLNAIEAKLQSLANPDERGATPWDQRTWVHVRSAIEVACYDLMGKSVGRPVVDLLGGAAREHVPFAAYLFYKYEGAGGEFGFARDTSAGGWAKARQEAALDPAGIVAQARAMIDHYGHKSIKLKGGAFEPQVEVESILALREEFRSRCAAAPRSQCDLARRHRHRRRQATRRCLGILRRPDSRAGKYGGGRAAVDIPLATNMCTTSFEDLPGSVAHQSESIILSDHHFWGGFRASLDLARFCAVFGRGMSMHSNSHLGISLAAMVHLAAAVPNLTYDCDTHYPWQDGHDLLVEPLQFTDGAVAVPSAPGLGVEIDRDRLAQLHQQYLACGLTERNDEVEMRKVQPGWTFQATRW